MSPAVLLDELGGTGADGLAPGQIEHLRRAATQAAKAQCAAHVPNAVLKLLDALKPQMGVRHEK